MVVWGRLALAVLGLAGLLWPLYGSSDSSAEPDPARISAYAADFTLAHDGRLNIRETVTTTMPAKRHGIYRFWDVWDPSDSHVRLVPEGIRVTQDGRPAQVDLSWHGVRRYRVARIGDPDHTLTPGRHVYVIRYHVDGAISPYGAGRSQLSWDLVPSGWQMPIARTTLHVHLPEPSSGSATCGVGIGDPDPCPVIEGAGTRELTFATGSLAPRTPVTVRVVLPSNAPSRVTVPWPGRVDGIASRSVPLAGGLVALSVLAALGGFVLARRLGERPPNFQLTDTAPEDVGPAQAAYLLSEQVPSSAVTATVLHLASRGLVELERTAAGWRVTGQATHQQWAQTDPVAHRVAEVLGVMKQGGRFDADGSPESGETLAFAQDSAGETVERWATEAGLMTTQPSLKPAFWTAVVLAVVGFAFNPWQVTLAGLPPALFAFGMVPLLRPGSTTRHTPAGRELWSRVGGFERTLATSPGRSQVDFDRQPDVYTASIPWAVAFGCAEVWEHAFESTVRERAPRPVWLYGGVGSVSGVTLTSVGMVDSFQSSLESSIGAYQASAAGTSSGGSAGGFSGGGGGGGGGGGSW